MRFDRVVLTTALLIAPLFVLMVSNDWLRHLISCESFGCISVGLLYFLISILIVVSFFICGIIFGPVPRFLSGLYAGGVATLAMVVSFIVIFMLNQWKIEEGSRAQGVACAQYPKLCPEKSAP